jgi:hypothetical protein
MAQNDQKPRKAEDTKYEEAEEVGLEGLAPGYKDGGEDTPPPEETRAPFDEA